MFWNQTPKDVLSDNNYQNNNFKSEIIAFLKDLIIIIIIVVIIRTFFILPFQISGQSMYDSYYDREFIIVNRFSYLEIPFVGSIENPERWDVIVFNTHIENKEYFIKRIIGLPWETIKIEWWNVYVKKIDWQDFIQLDEKYLMDTNYKATYVGWDDNEYIFEVPENNYFVMWDNRNASSDSRTCFSWCQSWKSNYINRDDIVWKVFIDLWYFHITSSFPFFTFTQPNLWIDTTPKFFSSESTYDYQQQ